VVSFSIHDVISPVRTYRRCIYGTVGSCAADCTVELVRGPGKWPIVRLLSYAWHVGYYHIYCRGVYGVSTIGVLCWSVGGIGEVPYHCRR